MCGSGLSVCLCVLLCLCVLVCVHGLDVTADCV